MRDIRVDILRFIGLSMIIFAHVEPPSILFQLRNFDVPLMVLVSGMSFSLSYRYGLSYLSYVIKRLRRLIAPVWVFLTFFFLTMYLFGVNQEKIDINTVFESYALIGGIGYVWIIRVFIMVALIAPFVFSFHRKVISNLKYYSYLSILFIFFEIIRYLTDPFISSGTLETLSYFTHYRIPYALIFSLGIRLYSASIKFLLIVSIINLVILVVLAYSLYLYSGELVPTQRFKYPPSYYYVSYAIFVAVGLFIISESIFKVLTILKLKLLIEFISNNSIWIYLWHIPFIMLLPLDNFLLRYIVVYSCSLIATFIQVTIVKKIIIPKCKSKKIQDTINSVLTG